MATTEDRLTEELEKLYRSPAARPPDSGPEPEPAPAPAHSEVFAKDARRLLFTWAAVIGVILLFEPTPDNPNVAIPAWAEFAAVGFLSALFATVFGLGNRRPWALRASLVAVGFGAVLAIACAATDHHTGGWWAYELGAFGMLGAMTMGAARRLR
jgi:peptidoglycan/LPS O-acetylase OafA/YrhL